MQSITDFLAQKPVPVPTKEVADVDRVFLENLKETLTLKYDEIEARAKTLEEQAEQVQEALDETQELLSNIDNLLGDIDNFLD